MAGSFLIALSLSCRSWGFSLLLPCFWLEVRRNNLILWWLSSTRNLQQTDGGHHSFSSRLGILQERSWWEKQRCGEAIWYFFCLCPRFLLLDYIFDESRDLGNWACGCVIVDLELGPEKLDFWAGNLKGLIFFQIISLIAAAKGEWDLCWPKI